MEPNKQTDAASSKPTADLEARLQAMRLGDPSSPQLHRAPTPSLLLNPQQELAPTAAPVEPQPPYMPQPPPEDPAPTAAPVEPHPPYMPQSPPEDPAPTAAPVEPHPPYIPPYTPQSPPEDPAPTAAPDGTLLPHQLQSQPEAQSYGAVELSSASGSGDRVRGDNRDWLVAHVNSLSFNAPATPVSLPYRSVEQSSCQGSTSASGPQAGTTDPFSAPGSNASLDTLVSDRLTQLDPRSRSRPQAIHRPLTMEENRALSRVKQLVPGNVGSADLSACVVRLLKEDREDVRRSVFNGVMGALHFVMGNSEWSVVFVELLSTLSPDELWEIVHVACDEGRGSLMSIANGGDGVNSLKKLFVAVRMHAGLRRNLINCLLNENEGLDLFQHSNGPDLLACMFAMFDREDCSALNNYNDVLLSEFGPKSMVECFRAAETPELQDLENIILSDTVELAKGTYSTYFLQRVLKRHGSDLLKERIMKRVIDHLVSLSLHYYGSYVVRECFRQMGPGHLTQLQRVFTIFRDLFDGQLAGLVHDEFASLVVRELLKTGKGVSPEETVALARRIQTLTAASLEHVDPIAPVGIVMKAVRKVLS